MIELFFLNYRPAEVDIALMLKFLHKVDNLHISSIKSRLFPFILINPILPIDKTQVRSLVYLLIHFSHKN